MNAVVVEGVSKKFEIPHEVSHTLKERALHPFRRSRKDILQALLDVSFSVEQGEFFGVVGRNGSGKSTLLKLMAGIYRADAGTIGIAGRLSTFIELGVGFNPDLAAEDNIVLNGVMLGLSPREARRRADSVIDFAGLQEFTELKLKNYSSGMLVRLAFSVMVQVDADVLLIDEVLAVGDAAFQQKCYDEFNRIREQGRTVLLVTHAMSAVERFCDRAMLLERGRVVDIGEPNRIANEYLDVNFQQEKASEHEAKAEREPDRFGDQRAEIAESWFEDEHGMRTSQLHSGRRCSFAARVRFNEPIDDPLFGFVLQNSQKTTVMQASTLDQGRATGSFAAGDEIEFRISFDNVFAPDRYFATPAIARGGGMIAWIDRRERHASVVVTGTRDTDAVVDIPFQVEIERGGVRA
ncbi:MAG TPA: ABC transporter ATP-binding protein [Thermoleophilaceae bacterium]|nr:ABC transporter ATP-binding protein [Thermoleophilaceae bacterium]